MKNSAGFKRRSIRFSLWAGLLLSGMAMRAQIIDYHSKQVIQLGDGTTVTLYAKAGSISDKSAGEIMGGNNLNNMNTIKDPAYSKEYYYLPPQIMLSKNPETGIPNFLFLKYTTEEREEQGGVQGALLHFLVQWGLTPEQRTELQQKLNQKVNGAQVKGPVDLFPAEGEQFRIISAVLSDKGMTKTIIASGKAPLLEGGKVAAAANLSKNGAQLLAATFQKAKSITDLSVEFNFKYYMRVPGLKGRITIDYQKIRQVWQHDKIDATYTYSHTEDKDEETTTSSQSWDELHEFYDNLVTNNAISIQIEDGFPSEASSKLKEMFFQFFMDKFTSPSDRAADKQELPKKKEDEKLPGHSDAYGYHVNMTQWSSINNRDKEVIELSESFLMPQEFSITGNLASWYNSLKDNKNCIASVNLNDPFFKRLDIRFILDLEAKEMFDQEVNYVTVNVRKKRDAGNPFMDRVTIDKKYVTEKGIQAALTYAAGEDKNPDMYQYMVQWSLRGGNLFPASPVWEVGQLEAVTLKPPVTPRVVEFEADLDKLKANNISRVTLQVRYMRFGKETEENINVSPAKGEALTAKSLFMDRDTKGYACRMVFNHTAEGKLATEWDSKINDNYVYAVIPDKLLDKTSEIFDKAKKAAAAITPPAADGTVTSDKILDGFKEIFGVVKSVIKK